MKVSFEKYSTDVNDYSSTQIEFSANLDEWKRFHKELVSYSCPIILETGYDPSPYPDIAVNLEIRRNSYRRLLVHIDCYNVIIIEGNHEAIGYFNDCVYSCRDFTYPKEHLHIDSIGNEYYVQETSASLIFSLEE